MGERREDAEDRPAAFGRRALCACVRGTNAAAPYVLCGE